MTVTVNEVPESTDSTGDIVEVLESAAADLAEEIEAAEDAKVTPDLDEEIMRVEAAHLAAQAEESAAAGVADEAEHHKLMDRVRWLTAKRDRLRAARAAQLAEAAEQRRREAVARAEEILTVETPLSAVVAAYRAAEQALDQLVQACAARQGAVEDASRLLRRAGVATPGGTRPSVTLDGSGLHGFGDAEAGPMVGELVLAVSEKHKLTSQGGTRLADVLARVAPRVSRGKVARLAAQQDAGGRAE
jgi:hypothetical protein